MYRKVNENVVVCDDRGFEVRLRMGRWVIEYQEEERLLEIDIDRVSTPLSIAIYSESIDRWEPPNEDAIGATDKERILENVKGALDVLDCPYQVV